jgi:hypothetical protein
MIPENPSNSGSLPSRNLRAPTADEIAARAHQIWRAEGEPAGRDVEHWLQAERELTAETQAASLPQKKRSIPASEDVRPSDVARPETPFSSFRDEAPLATKIQEQLVDPGRPASRRSKTNLDL